MRHSVCACAVVAVVAEEKGVKEKRAAIKRLVYVCSDFGSRRSAHLLTDQLCFVASSQKKMEIREFDEVGFWLDFGRKRSGRRKMPSFSSDTWRLLEYGTYCSTFSSLNSLDQAG